MSNLNFNRKKARRKRYNKKINIGILIFLCIIVGIFIGQVAINKKNNTQNTQAASVKEDTALASAGKDEKKEDKQPKKEEPIRKDVNVSKDGDKFTFSASEAQQAVDNKLTKDGKKVAFLTFDDGPSVVVTPKILDTLKRHDVKATFFILGKNLESGEKTRELLKREFDEGHAIANHTYSHDYKYLYPNRVINMENFLADVDKCNNLMKGVLGENFNTNVIRFPGGISSWKGRDVAKETLKNKNLQYVDWNALNGDAEGKPKNADELLAEIKKTVQGQEKVVILMHDIKERTAEALPNIIEYLKAEGYEFRTLK